MNGEQRQHQLELMRELFTAAEAVCLDAVGWKEERVSVQTELIKALDMAVDTAARFDLDIALSGGGLAAAAPLIPKPMQDYERENWQ